MSESVRCATGNPAPPIDGFGRIEVTVSDYPSTTVEDERTITIDRAVVRWCDALLTRVGGAAQAWQR